MTKTTKRTKGAGLGLLFASRATYEERMWQIAYDEAIKAGKTAIEAQRIADEAAQVAKGEKHGIAQNA
jgi:hypothetical protein